MPHYTELHASGELKKRVSTALASLAFCALCPRSCGVNRQEGEQGHCQNTRLARVASYSLHFGEEAPLVGSGGSGTIFFAGCNLNCAFCQNFDISHDVSDSTEVTADQLAWIMLELQNQGAQNINFVTPSHVVAQILEALPLAVEQGLNLPLVYNSSAYDKISTLKLLDGVIDIYMPDVKFWESTPADTYCQGAADYPECARDCVREMHRQVGDLKTDSLGLATRGLLIRHLLMPSGLAGTAKWMQFIARNVSTNTYVNIMDQYRPCGLASQFPELDRPLDPGAYEAALQEARAAGLTRIDDRESRMEFFFRSLFSQ